MKYRFYPHDSVSLSFLSKLFERCRISLDSRGWQVTTYHVRQKTDRA